MSTLNVNRGTLSICVAASILSSCSGQAGSSIVPPPNRVSDSMPFAEDFYYTGARQMFTVPAGITQIKVDAHGAQGGGIFGGHGGRVEALIPVQPGEKLAIYVGGQPSHASGGYNGGGSGGTQSSCGALCGSGGGGASDVRQGGDKLSDRVVVAGGAGGMGANASGFNAGYGGGGGRIGGSGGTGQSGNDDGGSGGGGATRSSGGSGGTGGVGATGTGNSGQSGSFGMGGAAGQGCTGLSCIPGGAGGGGGGGYYGGGGGGAGGSAQSELGAGGGGGGGASYLERRATLIKSQRGWRHAAGNGLVELVW